MKKNIFLSFSTAEKNVVFKSLLSCALDENNLGIGKVERIITTRDDSFSR